MAIGKLSGLMLQKNLIREGTDLRFDNDLLYLDVGNRQIGVRTDNVAAITEAIHVINGNVRADCFIGNICPDPTANLVVHVNGTGALCIPLGNTAQQPLDQNVNPGAIRYNTDREDLEYFDGYVWSSISNEVILTNEAIYWSFTITDSDEASSQDTFPLKPNTTTTANALVVTLNGVAQAPQRDYVVTANNEIQFCANGPENLRSGDYVDIRYISTTTAYPPDTIVTDRLVATLINGRGSLTDISNLAPISSNSVGNIGEIAWDSTHLYLCVEANAWIRTSIDTSW